MARNTIILLSDEHAPSYAGFAGHPFVQTPNIDRLAAAGTVFSSAYCTSPICVPSRAGIATGRYPHQHGYWDNAFPYDGRVRGWGHELLDHNIDCVSVGKLHYRNATDPVGLSEQINPMHVIDGVGDLVGMIRDGTVVRTAARKYYENAGEGDSTYQRYDVETAERAGTWLRDRANSPQSDRPFTLLVSFVTPHFPLIARSEFLELYPTDRIELPPSSGPPETWHPAIRDYARLMNFLPQLSEANIKASIAAYCALVTFMDAQVGVVLEAITEAGFDDDTMVIYTSDHGDNVGRDGLFGKSTMYEDSVGVPLIARGNGFPAGTRHTLPVSHVDLYQTILENHGLTPSEPGLPGTSLQVQLGHKNRSQPVLSEYHATCSTGGITMLRYQQWKYVHFAGYGPQLFDLQNDPGELTNLANDPDYADTARELAETLSAQIDPADVDRRAKADQNARLEAHGGRSQILASGTLGYTPAPGETPDRG